MRKTFTVCLVCFLAFTLVLTGLSVSVSGADIFNDHMPAPPKVENVGTVYVYNIENERLIYSYQAEKTIYPSSLVKVMSALVACERLEGRLEERVTLTSEMLEGTTGTHLGLKAGETFSVRQLLYAAFCGSNNDAVNAIACIVSGSVAEFVADMNERALELGATSTNFVNPTGIHNKAMVSTTKDIAKICLAASANPLVSQITDTERYEIPKTEENERYMIYTRNMLLTARYGGDYVNKHAVGLNAGMTNEGGECVATVAKKDGLSYLCIVTGGKTVEEEPKKTYISSYRLANEMINWCFESFGYVTLFDESLPCADVKVTYGNKVDQLSAHPTDKLVMYLPTSFDPVTSLTFRPKLLQTEFEAPVEEGMRVGSMAVYYEGVLVGEVDLVTFKGAERDEFMYALGRIKGITQNRFFLLTVGFFAFYIVLFLIIGALFNRTARRAAVKAVNLKGSAKSTKKAPARKRGQQKRD